MHTLVIPVGCHAFLPFNLSRSSGFREGGKAGRVLEPCLAPNPCPSTCRHRSPFWGELTTQSNYNTSTFYSLPLCSFPPPLYGNAADAAETLRSVGATPCKGEQPARMVPVHGGGLRPAILAEDQP